MGSFGLNEIELPSVKSGVIFEKTGDFITVEGFGTSIRWNGDSALEIELDSSLAGKTCGLCGNFDGDMENDAMTMNGKSTDSPAILGNSWEMPDPINVCHPVPDRPMCASANAELITKADFQIDARSLIGFLDCEIFSGVILKTLQGPNCMSRNRFT